MRPSPVLHLLFVCIILSLSVASERVCTNSNDDDKCSTSSSSSQRKVYEPECVYYLAPSSIPNSGFGTYTVRDIPENTLLMHQAGAPSIVVSDIENHSERNTKRKYETVILPFAVHKNYFWDGRGLADFEVEDVHNSVTTFGALANYHPFLFNLHPTVEEIDDSIVPRASRSPGIGAYSYYMGFNFVTNRFIPKGEELFTSYGMV